MKKNKNRMSGFDWFAVLSGVIGLVADFVTIGSIAHKQDQSAGVSTVVLVLLPVLILYSTIILSFYSRRIAIVRHLKADKALSKDSYQRIERGAMVIAKVIGIPMLLVYGASLVLSFSSDARVYNNLVTAVILGSLGGWVLTDMLGRVAGEIYAAFDPKYNITKTNEQSESNKHSVSPDR